MKEKKKLPPGMIAPTMAARITHLWHNMLVEGIQQRAAKRQERLDTLGELGEIPMTRSQRRAEQRMLNRKSKSRKPKSP